MIDDKDAMKLLSCVEHDKRLHSIMLEVLTNQAVCEEIKEIYEKLLMEVRDARRTK